MPSAGALPFRLALASLAFGIGLASLRPATRADESPEALAFFEKSIRPLLIEKCQRCHGEKKQESGLRLDTRQGFLKGGENGAVFSADRPSQSRILKAIRHDGDPQMPPDEKLADGQIELVRTWLEQGAPWTRDSRPTGQDTAERQRRHWAFQQVVEPKLPEVQRADWARMPLDRFVLAKMEAAGFGPSPEADKRTLIRRATYDLTGLPPTPEEVEAFLADDSPEAYARLVDRLLDSPAYGEQAARMWLDVARYADTKGYVYAREERFFIHASRYRDWVVAAMRDDMPYDRFLKLQLAADLFAPDEPRHRAAMGFLTLGRRFLGVPYDIIDDRIDVVSRATMGLTVACARCHDHKFDPIPTADYYSLYGVFQNCAEVDSPIDPAAWEATLKSEAPFAVELRKRLATLEEKRAARKIEGDDAARALVGEYLMAQRELSKYPPESFDQILTTKDLLPPLVRRWDSYLLRKASEDDPIFSAWRAFADLPVDGFTEAAKARHATWASDKAATANPFVREKFATSPIDPNDLANRYAELFKTVDDQWRQAVAKSKEANEPTPTRLIDDSAEALRQVLYGDDAPGVLPDESPLSIETLYNTGAANELFKLQGDVDRWLLTRPEGSPLVSIVVDRPKTTDARILKRGNPLNRGEFVPRRFLAAVAGAERPRYEHGSGRREMAEAIVAPTNPLTARVMVNRVFARHFGQPLVKTQSDFGLRADAPSHPELLDWLAARFVAEGWSLKWLHRTLMLSATYRQRSVVDDANKQAAAVDPENRLLWRMNPRRLSFEEFRDTLLQVAGQLDRTPGGKSEDMFAGGGEGFRRRALYGLVDRQFLAGTLRAFDFANPDLHVAQRAETTTPQQALFALNHPFPAARAKALAERHASLDPPARVAAMFRDVYQRSPSPEQAADAVTFVTSAADEPVPVVAPTVAAWSYGFGTWDPAANKLDGFTPLPYFSGQAWQGAAAWPDVALGWVQLHAQGGHPGNDLAHASVRRWTAPKAGRVTVESLVKHDVEAGDGIRCSIWSSRHGWLVGGSIHNRSQRLDVANIEVQPGDTLDFVCDIGVGLNNDQHLWTAEIKELDVPGPTVWNSAKDFMGPTTPSLDPWAQLAQALLLSNELMFVD